MTGFGHPRVHHRLTDSTNGRARELALAGAGHGTLITADSQTAGRGRAGRTWSATPGEALLMSVVVRALEPRHALLPLAVAVAICEACEETAAVETRIKWPNDIWIEGRKLAGILIEGRPREGWAVIGVGLNISTAREGFPPELRETATSLALVTGERAPERSVVLDAVLAQLERWLDASAAETLAAWRSRDALEGLSISWERGAGTARGVDAHGALLVETAEGPVALDAGEVHLGKIA